MIDCMLSEAGLNHWKKHLMDFSRSNWGAAAESGEIISHQDSCKVSLLYFPKD